MADTITLRTSTERDVVKIVERGPQGPAGGGGGEGSGTVTSVALASSDLTITGSPITTSGTITANLGNSGVTAGTYTKVTVDAKGRVTDGATATASDVGAAADVNPSVLGTLEVVDGVISCSQYGMTINAEENVITFSSVPALNGATILREGDLGNRLVLNANGSNSGAFTGGTGGSVDVRGGNALSTGGNGGNGGSINLRGGDAANNQGGSGESGGSIDLSGSNFGAGGSINLSSAGNGNGGSINTYAGGGSINTSVGGGSIDTRGTGSIEFGIAGTRTTLTGTATADRAISLPNAAGTLALTSDITKTAVGLGNVTNNAQVTSVSGTAPIVSSGGTTPTISVTTGTTAGTVAAGDHTHSQLHDRSHAITSTSDHTATANRVFYSNNSGQVTELALGAANTVLTSNGTTSAPSFAAVSAGATNLWIPASAWIPRTTTGCGVDSTELSTNKVNTDQLLFDTATEEYAQAMVMMPSNYNYGTITARFYWTASSGSGGVAFGLRGRAYADDDALDAAQGTGQVTTDTFIVADDLHVTAATSAITLAGTPAANRPVQFEIYRQVSNASDTLGVDARLLGVEVIFN